MTLTIDVDGVLADLRDLRERFGGPDGARRLAWTPEWEAARDWLLAKLEDLPVTVERDPAGNIWATLPGAGETEGFVIVGSHIDAVPAGSRSTVTGRSSSFASSQSRAACQSGVHASRRAPSGPPKRSWSSRRSARTPSTSISRLIWPPPTCDLVATEDAVFGVMRAPPVATPTARRSGRVPAP